MCWMSWSSGRLPSVLKLLEFIDYRPEIVALDIGFGTGFPLTELAMRLGESSIVYGIDPWKKAIERVNRKIDSYGITNIKIFEGFAETLPLEDGSVDLITSNNGINNVKDIDRVLSECSRVMRKAGQFIQTMNLDKSMVEFYGTFEGVLSDLHMDNEIGLMHRQIAQKRPPLGDIISMIGKHGFMVKDLVHDQFSYRFADGTAMLHHYFIRVAFMGSWIRLLPEDKVDKVFEMIEYRLNEQSRKTGVLKLTIPFVMINAVKA